MTAPPAAFDVARASVLVRVPIDVAFRVFSEDIDQWWRRGLKYRMAGKRQGIIHLEPQLGGRLFESFEGHSGPRVCETGRVTTWEPPSRLGFEWRAQNFAPGEVTHVDVAFSEAPGGTLVTVSHSGWSTLRLDHPARHGKQGAPFIAMNGLWWGGLLSSLREHVAARYVR